MLFQIRYGIQFFWRHLLTGIAKNPDKPDAIVWPLETGESRMDVTIENMRPEDFRDVVSIFDESAAAEDLVLDTDNPKSMDLDSGKNLVARVKDRVIGWAIVEPADRDNPGGAASVSVFVSPGFRRMGIGSSLLNAAIDMSARSGVTSLLTGIVPKNIPALLLHKQCGFKAIGMLQKAGISRGRMQDAVLLQRQCT
jgi:L-amino acid N-acyltransferase YncA